tara:strand:- start:260 stop:2290 length:2031 start_codon:yes stop_codon:yes gene_type:complete
MKRELDPFDDTEDVSEHNTMTSSFRSGVMKRAISRWWMVLILMILGLAVGIYLKSTKRDNQTAMSVIEVNRKDVNIMGEGLETDNTQSDILIATTIAKITTREILLAVAADKEVQSITEMVPPKWSLKPLYLQSADEQVFAPASSLTKLELANILSNWVKVSSRQGTTLIEVSVSHPKPETTIVIVDTVTRVFIDKEATAKSGGNIEASSILENEAQSAQEKLRLAEKSSQVYTRAIEMRDKLDPARAGVVILRQRYKSLHPKRRQAEGVYKDLLKSFGIEINRVMSVSTELPHWKDVADKLAKHEGRMQLNGLDGLDAADEWLALAQSSLSARSAFLKATIAQQSTIYQTAKKRISELGIAQQNTFDDLLIVEQAKLLPASSQKRSMPLVCLMLGGACGAGLAYLLALFDYKIHNVFTAEEFTELSCLAAIMKDKEFGLNVKGEWKSVIGRDSNSLNAEAIRNLRSSIILLGKKERHRSILITSAIQAEGKSSISVETAAAFAMSKEKTLLIDFDLRRYKLSSFFPKLDQNVGIVEVLSGQALVEEAIQHTEIENLDVILSGSRVANPGELLHEVELENLMKTLNPMYDRIIIDSAPVLAVSDSRVIAKHVNDVILIAKAHKTPGGAVMRAKQLLAQGGANIVGIVVNDLKIKAKGYGYYGYKGYGEYGEEYGQE